MHHRAQVLCPDINMDKDGLWTARDGVVAVRGRECWNLKGAKDDFWCWLPKCVALGDRFLDREGIGAGVEEEVGDAVREQGLDVRFCDLDIMEFACSWCRGHFDPFSHLNPPVTHAVSWRGKCTAWRARRRVSRSAIWNY